ncbi:MAG: metal-sensitive transcriptional regulator [Acidimicrobiia bacterium]
MTAGGQVARLERDVRQRLVTARGHVDGVIRMVDDGRCCVDVLHQILAVQGALRQARRDLVEHHLRACISDAFTTGRVEGVVEELLAAVFDAAPADKTEQGARA